MSLSLSYPIFQNEDKARAHLEKQRWPHGPVCPHCGATKDDVKAIKGPRARPSKAHPDGKERKGLYQCNLCRRQFTVTVKTVFERSKIPLNTWLAASYLMTTSEKGISAHQIHRTLGVTYKTAWFITHRIREAMGESPLDGAGRGEKDRARLSNWRDASGVGLRKTKRKHRTRLSAEFGAESLRPNQ